MSLNDDDDGNNDDDVVAKSGCKMGGAIKRRGMLYDRYTRVAQSFKGWLFTGEGMEVLAYWQKVVPLRRVHS
jgi:hypothetical protein